mgnify:CR=1 FL=1
MKFTIFLFFSYLFLILSLKGCSYGFIEESEQSCYKASTGELWCLDELEE